MLQKIIGNQIAQSFLAKFWKTFKQKNPIAAGIIFMVSSSLILYSTTAPDYGMGLPSWLSQLVTVCLLIVNGANGSDTYQYLEDKPNK